MRRLSRLALSLVTAPLLHLAACGDPPADPAHFAGASEAQQQRALVGGAGIDGAFGFFIAAAWSSLPPGETACPRVSRSGDTVTIATDCTQEDGDVLRGTLVATNVPPFFGEGPYDPNRPSVVRFDGFEIDDRSDENEDLAFDGEVTTRPDGSMTAALTTLLGGLELRLDATWRRSGERSQADAGSTVELTGLGQAEIRGSWNMDSDAPAGALELHGADVLRVDFDRMVDGCAPITVDGVASGALCDSAAE